MSDSLNALFDQENTRLAYDALANLNMDDFEGLSLDDIAVALRALAERASQAQLHAFLNGAETLPSEFDDKETLARRYVERRMRTVTELRRLRDSFNLVDIG